MKKLVKYLLSLALAFCTALSLIPVQAEAASWNPDDRITIKVRVYDMSSGSVYEVGNDSVRKGDEYIQSDPYQIPPLTKFVDANKFGKVDHVAGNWYFPTGDQQPGVTINWSCNSSTATMTYWVNHYYPNGGTGGSGDGSIEIGDGTRYTFKFTLVYHSNYPSGVDYQQSRKYTVHSWTPMYNVFASELLSYSNLGFGGFEPKKTENTWYKDDAATTEMTLFDAADINGKTMHIYAGWVSGEQAEEVTLTYLDRGQEYAKETMLAGDTATIRDNTNTHQSYTFKGWATTENGSVVYKPGDETTVNSDITLYAVWEKKAEPKYTYYLNYDANGGTGGPANKTVTSTAASYSFTVSDVEPVRDGYTFKGWTMSYPTEGTEFYVPGRTISVTSTNPGVKLKAQWEENPRENSFAVNYNPNGAQGEIPSQTLVTTETSATFVLNDSTGFTYEGFKFLGWSTTPDGEVEYQPGTEVTLTTEKNTLDLYAKWEKKDPDAEKKESKPTLDKVIVTEDGHQDSAPMNPGAEVKFLLKSNVPGNLYKYAEEFTMEDENSPIQMVGTYKMVFHDDLGDKFTLMNDEDHPVQVLLNGVPVDQKYYEVIEDQNCTSEGHTCDFHVTVDLVAMYNDGVIKDTDVAKATELSVAYTAKFADDASTGKHSNYAWLETEEPEKPRPDEVFVDVFGLKIVKFGDGNEEKLLSGAYFKLYNSDKTEVVREGSTTDGILVFDALPAGTYYLYETAAPTNYVRSTEPMEIQIVPGNENISSENGLVNYYIKKVNNTTAPSTGGTGTLLFTVGGGALLAAGVIILVYRRRKQEAEESR